MTTFRSASVALVFVVSAALFAQNSQQERTDTLNVDVQLIQLPVSVLDKDGRPVSNLRKGDFQILEDGVEQQISLFQHEDIPLSAGMVIDNSGSMRNKRARVNQAALIFARESNPQDETFIVNFDSDVYLEQDFTNRIDALVAALSRLDTRGETALYDAVFLSAEHLNEAKNDKKALLLVSDGEDNKSRYNLDRVITKVRQSKATVYAIGLLEGGSGGGLFSKSPAAKAKEALRKLASTTGGRAYFPGSVEQVDELCRRIARDLRNQYTLGYTPSNAKMDGGWRRITVRVNPPKALSKITVSAKDGYYAPQAAQR